MAQREMTDLLDVRFTASNTVRSKRPYTTYEIEVRSSSTMPWLLYKRYRDFYVLHQNLTKLMATKSYQNQTFKLADLPPKRLVRSLAPEVVHKRQRQLEQYIHHILKYSQLTASQEVLEFLSVPESLKVMLQKKKSDPQGQQGRGGPHGGSYDDRLDVPVEKRQIEYLLRELNSQKNRVKALAKFEQWYFDSFPPIRQEYIKLLLVGADLPGLLHSCRLVSSKVAWRGAISLLVRLLDIERNKHARMFQEIFFMLEPAIYREMDLHKHIKDATQEDGFKIVKLIKDHHPELDPKFYVPEAEAWTQFQKWEKIQNDALQVRSKEPEEREKERAYNWKEHNYTEIADKIISHFDELSNENDDEYQIVSSDSFNPDLNSKFNNELSVMYKKDFDLDEWKMKISFVINHSPDDVFNFLVKGYVETNDGQREGWNRKIVDQIVDKGNEKSDPNHFVVHETYKSFNSPYKFRDFVVLRCLRKNYKNQNKKLIVFASISNYDRIPESKDKLRTIILPSGFEIEQYHNDPTKSYVSFRAHMTSESVLLVSADLLGETDELFQSMARIGDLVGIMKQNKK